MTTTKSPENGRKEGQPAMQHAAGRVAARVGGGAPQMLVKEKALTRARDALAAERRRMPWMAVEKAYVFDGPEGKASLLDLFEGRRQLIVYRAFFEPGVHGWPDHACLGCSLGADQVAHLAHLNARDTTLAYASRAPQADIARLKARMGWTMPWYTITDSFDADFGVDEWHGHNVFIRDGERVFRTYFINGRGDEAMGTTWSYLDMTALGRQETWEDSPQGYPQSRPYKWWNWHDSYVPERGARSEMDRGVGRRRGGLSQIVRRAFEQRNDETHHARLTLISNPSLLLHPGVGQRRGWPKPSADRMLALAAAPTFAIMALLTGIQDLGMPGMLCSASQASPLTGMVPMYLLMSAFHSAPWLRLMADWRKGGALRTETSRQRP